MTIFLFCLSIACFCLGYSIARKKYRYVQTYAYGYLSELEKGEMISITSPLGFLIDAKVHVNSPDTERIVLEVDTESQGVIYPIYDYSDPTFDDFEMLNVDAVERPIDNTDMESVLLSNMKNDLRVKLEFFLSTENYEEATKIRDEIKKLK